jgi:phosphohistidine phosphatase
MKTLLLMRHAKSSWSDSELADHDRPLNNRGERDAPRMGRWLADQPLLPDVVIASTALRAVQTATAVCQAAGHTGDFVEFPELYHADVAAWTAVLQQIPDGVGSVLAIGHNPGLEELVETLNNDWERMPTAAIAWFELAIDDWAEFRPTGPATLRAIWRPKELVE